jgi:hypothetical protein
MQLRLHLQPVFRIRTIFDRNDPEKFSANFFSENFFWWKYALKSIFTNQKDINSLRIYGF